MRYKNLSPTSRPDLFVTREGRLLHRVMGPLKHASGRSFLGKGSFLTLPDKTSLRVYWGAPQIELEIEPFDYAKLEDGVSDVASVVGKLTGYVSDASNYITVAQLAIQVLDLLIGAIDQTGAKLAAIDQELHALASQIGALDYVALLRRMADMRGNALAIVQTLDALRTMIAGSPPDTWYTEELRIHDAQLQSDINALLDPSGGYFRRPYSEQAITGDGVWMRIISDSPIETDGTTFEYRMALPTVALLIAVRLAMMKFTVPDFVSRHTFSTEIMNWYHGVGAINEQMQNHVRTTSPPTPVEVQCARRQSDGHQRIGEFSNWEQHCTIGAPYSISPIGAVDITTGFGIINWEYTQFDEWYLRQGDLHGSSAGYWPPSVGPQYYTPPPQATGLPPLERAISEYYSMAQGDANAIALSVIRQIGGDAAFALEMWCLSFGMPEYSDIRLKQDIAQIGHLKNGPGLYRYRYKWDDQIYVGVVAQEVAIFMPDAVLRGPDGYLRVDYGRLGTRLMTWDEWVAASPDQGKRGLLEV